MRFMNGLVFGSLLLGAVGSYAEEGVGLKELEKQVTALSQEVSKLKQAGTPAGKENRSNEGITFGGYGEMVYHDFAAKTDAGDPSGKKNTLDLLRFVLNVGYRFSEKFVLNSEIEFEHANEEKRGRGRRRGRGRQRRWRRRGRRGRRCGRRRCGRRRRRRGQRGQRGQMGRRGRRGRRCPCAGARTSLASTSRCAWWSKRSRGASEMRQGSKNHHEPPDLRKRIRADDSPQNRLQARARSDSSEG